MSYFLSDEKNWDEIITYKNIPPKYLEEHLMALDIESNDKCIALLLSNIEPYGKRLRLLDACILLLSLTV